MAKVHIVIRNMMHRITDHSDGLVKAFPCKATDVFHFDRYKKLGRYKQRNGLLEWNTGLRYFLFSDKFLCYF